MKLIPLTQGRFAKVDDEDYEELSQYNWHITGRGYAARNLSCAGHAQVYMHRSLLGVLDPKISVDHINSDCLDNRRVNLRRCSQSQNLMNSRRSKANTSGFKGVTWNNHCQRWMAQIKYNRKNHYLGLFADLRDAAAAYNAAALEHFGAFARPNQLPH